MIELLPYDYQEHQIRQDAQLIASGKRCIVNQLNTGGGKTVEFATIAFRYTTLSMKKVFIMVHRDELLNQSDKTLKEWYGIDAQLITKGNNKVYDKDVYIGMVETCFKRLQRDANYFPEIGLVILDEAHLGNFRKIHQFFPNAIIIAFTATPIYTDKKYPMHNDYEDIIVGPQVNELIKRRALCQNITYSVGTVSRNGLRLHGSDFDETEMGKEYSKFRHVKNVIDMYEQLAPNTKTICYNVNIEHSLKVTEAFKSKDYDVRHIDGKTSDEEREEIFKWFETKDSNILCNVGIATMGYDNPYVTNIIDNFSTMSLVKWLQTAGRGGRICQEINKTYFSILDLGFNGKFFGDWNQDRDWKDIFFNPPKKRSKTDAAPYKDCPNCRALIPIQAMVCPYCDYQYTRKAVAYDEVQVSLQLITKNLNVEYICETNSNRNAYYSLFLIENDLIRQTKYQLGNRSITHDDAKLLIDIFMPLAEKWSQTMNKSWRHHEQFCKKHIVDKIEKTFGYKFNEIEAIRPIDSISSIV